MTWFTELTALIAGIFQPAVDLVDNVHTSTEEKLQLRNELLKIQNDMISKITDFFTKVLEAQAEILKVELSGSWLQRNWRPLLMIGISTAVLNNLLLVPYLNAIFGWSVITTVTPELWNMLTIGLGGYVGGRSVEKIVETIKGK